MDRIVVSYRNLKMFAIKNQTFRAGIKKLMWEHEKGLYQVKWLLKRLYSCILLLIAIALVDKIFEIFAGMRYLVSALLVLIGHCLCYQFCRFEPTHLQV